jgi:hypothetical protein
METLEYAQSIVAFAEMVLAGLLLCLAVPAVAWFVRFFRSGGRQI